MFAPVAILLTAVSLVFAKSTSNPETAAAAADLITNLPGLDFPINYNQYSGYLEAGDNVHLHYWFIESQNSPSTDPLLLWLNGGPGCSSLDGLLNELGPFHINEDSKTLYNNSYTWNTFANIIYLESPACVGFSYSAINNCSASDNSTKVYNYNALKSFFAKYPSYRSNPFFVTGESYAGVYVPTLTLHVLQNKDTFPINLQGFAIGNGLSSFKLNDNSIIFFANYHGLLGQNLWDQLVDHCCDSDIPSKETCNFADSAWPVCQDRVNTATNIIFNCGLNMYNLYDNCLTPSSGSYVRFSRYHADRSHVMRRHHSGGSGLNGLIGLDPPCTDSSVITKYLNDPAVQAAIHVSNITFDICSDEVNANYVIQHKDLSPEYTALQRAGVRGLVYNGDVDMACNFIGDQWFVEDLNFKEVASRRMWHSGGQVGGFVKRFEGLDLMTVRGSGHMVPQDRPGPALDMMRAFVLGQSYP